MATVAQKSFYAHLFDASGVLAKVDHELVFFGDDGETITTVEPSMINFLTVLGETGVSNTQALADLRHGGAAWTCTHRAQEVR